MSLGFDPEFAQIFAPMAEAMAHATPPAVGDVPARRAMWEPIIGAASAAQPIPTDVTAAEHHATADDGTLAVCVGSDTACRSAMTPPALIGKRYR